MMFPIRKIDSVQCLSFGYDFSYPICLLCVHLWLPRSVEAESVELYFQGTRMQAVLEIWFALFLVFFWALAFVVCLSLFSFTLCCLSLCSQPCPRGFQQPSSKTFQKKTDRSQDALILLSLPWLFRTRVPSGTGAWTVGSWLPTVEKSSGDALSRCNTKKFFEVLISLPFKCVYKPRSDWNWSTVELTEKQTNWKRQLFYLFRYLRKKCWSCTVFLFEIHFTSNFKCNFVKTWNFKKHLL